MAHVEIQLRNLLEQIASEQGYKNYNLDISPASSGGGNYSSALYKATIEENDKKVLNLFIKIGVIGDQIRDSMDLKIFDAEQYVYETMQNIFRQLEDRHGVVEEDRLLMPKYYGVHTVVKEEILVLQNLVIEGFTTYDRHKSVDWAYASSAVKELAKFHALTMAFHKEHPIEHEKFCKNLTTAWLTEETYNSFLVLGFSKALEAVRNENRDRLKTFFNTIDIETMREVERPVRRAVLTHSDYVTSNLMHKCNKDGSIQVVPVDYQTLRPGCVVIDLLYFIFNGTDEEFRRVHYSRLIEHYYTELSAAMNRLGVENSYYSRDDFEYELKKKQAYGLIVAAYPLPVVTVDFEDAPKVEDGVELTFFSSCKTTKLYVERLNGIVDDYVRWGVI